MGVTRLKRKGLRNKANAKKRQDKIKQLTKQPPIKSVDVEAIKAEFEKKGGSKKADTSKTKEEAAVKKDAAEDLKKGDTTAEKKEPAKAQVKDTKEKTEE
ncbi:hypothetical protein OKW21_001111 [Catalinimonas alkaloidigena]|uniref:hypothetical protein n=1 Tax=Catalinimonas alkaloidigena TaxID=1075417 RepID=UPI002405D2EA|nr:hypothetical protein [Catalinimonas alkaloidigena]MDF9795848.1 hypothetical protein [Catalinimonas alkaloidigena]